MSYRTYLYFETKNHNSKIYSLFVSDVCPEEVVNYVTNGDKNRLKELEENNFIIRDFEIKDFYDFCYKVVVEISNKILKEQNKFYNTGTYYTDFIPVGKLYQSKIRSQPVSAYLGWQHWMVYLNIKNNPSLKFYNLIEFMKKYNLINVDTFELKPNMKITLNVTRATKKEIY